MDVRVRDCVCAFKANLFFFCMICIRESVSFGMSNKGFFLSVYFIYEHVTSSFYADVQCMWLIFKHLKINSVHMQTESDVFGLFFTHCNNLVLS